MKYLFLFYERANFPTVEPLFRQLAKRWPGEIAVVKGFDFKEASGETAPWELPADLPVVGLPLAHADLRRQWHERSQAELLPAQGPLAAGVLGEVLGRPYLPYLREWWAEVAASTETLLTDLRPEIIVLPEDTDYIRGRLAGRIAKELGLAPVVLSAHYYDRFARYPLIGKRYADHFLVLNEVAATRLKRQGVEASRLHVVGNVALNRPPALPSPAPRFLLCGQGRPGEATWIKDVIDWFADHPDQELWIRPHPQQRAVPLRSVFPENVGWAPNLGLNDLLNRVRAVVGESTSVLWQASSAGLPVIIVHYRFGPCEIALPPEAFPYVARTKAELAERLGEASGAPRPPIAPHLMVSSGSDPVDKCFGILEKIRGNSK